MAFDIVGFYKNIILDRIVTALIIFFLGFMLGRIAGNLTKRLLEEVSLNKTSFGTFFGRTNLEKALSMLVTYTIYILTVTFALNALGITRYVFIGILLFFVALLLSALALDVRELLPNLYAFIKIKSKRYFSEKDRIKSHLAEGVVVKITPFTTRIITDRGDELYIQNCAVIENLIVEKKHKS